MHLLWHDKNRVWWEDTEADVFSGNDVYVNTLQEWARISRGAFSPQNITETWEGEKGPVRLEFALNGQQCSIRPVYRDDYLDMGVLFDLNRLIKETGYQLEAYEAFDQTAFVVVLTSEEKRGLERERGWSFAT